MKEMRNGDQIHAPRMRKKRKTKDGFVIERITKVLGEINENDKICEATATRIKVKVEQRRKVYGCAQLYKLQVSLLLVVL